MVKNFLTTLPRHDVPTSYLYDFAKGIIKTAREMKDIHITDLKERKATRTFLEKALKKEKPGLIFLNGHGNKRFVTGHKDEVILDEKNINLAEGAIVYALACNSLEELGPLAIKQGIKTYIGYKARFMVIRDTSRMGTPQKDKNALPFKRACHALISSLVLGSTVREAIKRTKDEYLHSIRSYGTSEDDPYGDVPLIRFALAWNLEFLDMQGNQQATFS